MTCGGGLESQVSPPGGDYSSVLASGCARKWPVITLANYVITDRISNGAEPGKGDTPDQPGKESEATITWNDSALKSQPFTHTAIRKDEKYSNGFASRKASLTMVRSSAVAKTFSGDTTTLGPCSRTDATGTIGKASTGTGNRPALGHGT